MLKYWYQKGQRSSERLKSCCGGWSEETRPPPLHRRSSLQLGANLQECRFLLHDAHQQRVNVVLQISDLRLQLPQLQLPLGQQNFLLPKLDLLPLQVGLPLHQQGDQFAVGEVVVRARSIRQELETSGMKSNDKLEETSLLDLMRAKNHSIIWFYLLPVRLLLAGLAAPPGVDRGLELLQAGGQYRPALGPPLLRQRGGGQGLHWVGAAGQQADTDCQETFTQRQHLSLNGFYERM